MIYFIHHVQTYSGVNKKGREICEFASSFQHILINDDCSFDAFKCAFEQKVKELNACYPKVKPITFHAGTPNADGGQFHINVDNDEYNPVCFLSYSVARGYYTYSEGISSKGITAPGICRTCGCTENDPCHHPDHGTCWWADESETICSHCADPEISNSPQTQHCINTKGDKQ